MNEYRNCMTGGWTLSETLVMMIVAGVVFLAVMEGLGLFNRYMGMKTTEIMTNMRLYEGYYLLRHLTASADSVSMEGTPDRGMCIRLFREDVLVADLSETADSALIARRGTRLDTLMSSVSGLGLSETSQSAGVDTIKLSISTSDGNRLALGFPVVPAAIRPSLKDLREQERQYAYE
jgi:hypothetical protein